MINLDIVQNNVKIHTYIKLVNLLYNVYNLVKILNKLNFKIELIKYVYQNVHKIDNIY